MPTGPVFVRRIPETTDTHCVDSGISKVLFLLLLRKKLIEIQKQRMSIR